MDFGELFGIAALVIYFLLRNLGGKKKSPSRGRKPSPDSASTPSAGDELSEALRQIRRELGFESPEPEEEAAAAETDDSIGIAAPEPVPETTVPESRLEKEEPREPAGAAAPTKIDVPRRPTPAYRREEKFESLPSVGVFEREENFERGLPSLHAEASSAASVEAAAEALRERRSGTSHPALSRLRTHKEIREAIVLREILGPPKARR